MRDRRAKRRRRRRASQAADYASAAISASSSSDLTRLLRLSHIYASSINSQPLASWPPLASSRPSTNLSLESWILPEGNHCRLLDLHHSSLLFESISNSPFELVHIRYSVRLYYKQYFARIRLFFVDCYSYLWRQYSGLELSGSWGVEPPPQFMSTDTHFWMKINRL